MTRHKRPKAAQTITSFTVLERQRVKHQYELERKRLHNKFEKKLPDFNVCSAKLTSMREGRDI